MANPQPIIDAMEQLGIQLDYLVPDIGYMRDAASADVRNLEQDIQWRLDSARADLAHAEAAYSACMSTPVVNEAGESMPPNCDSLADRVRECEHEVYRLESLLNRLQEAASEFENAFSKVQSIQSDTIPSAKIYLKERIAALSNFEQDQLQMGATAVQISDSVPVSDRAAVMASAIRVLTSPKMQSAINQLVGEYGENQGVKALKDMGAARAGTGLHYGKHGVDAYGLRNTKHGKTLLIMEAKSTADGSKRGTPREIMGLLKLDQQGYQQGSRAYSNHRILLAAKRDSRVAKHIRSEMAHGQIRQTINYVHWVNVATGEEKTYRALSNQRGNKVSTLTRIR